MSAPTGRWWEEAACLGMAPMFDADTYGNSPYTAAKGTAGSALNVLKRLKHERKSYRIQLQVCASCPVRRACVKDTVEHERRAMRKPGRKSPWTQTMCIAGGYMPTERLLWHLNATYPADTPLGELARLALRKLAETKGTDINEPLAK